MFIGEPIITSDCLQLTVRISHLRLLTFKMTYDAAGNEGPVEPFDGGVPGGGVGEL